MMGFIKCLFGTERKTLNPIKYARSIASLSMVHVGPRGEQVLSTALIQGGLSYVKEVTVERVKQCQDCTIQVISFDYSCNYIDKSITLVGDECSYLNLEKELRSLEAKGNSYEQTTTEERVK